MMTAQIYPIPEDLKFGAIIVTDSQSASPLPLEHTDVVAMVNGPLSSVSVTQRFGNPFKHPVELAYLFPLPHEAAVVDYELRIGERVVRATVQELEAARQAYREARDRGQRAGLLEQRRPNLFSSEIANVQPGETIIATIRYQQRLRYDDGYYCFTFPMGLTPKYHSDPAEGRDTNAPVAAKGEEVGAVDITVTVDAGGESGMPESPSHSIEATSIDERRFNVRLAGHTIPNKDFVLRYRVADEAVSAAAWASTSEGGATVMVTALPPRLTGDFEPAPREFIFVIDRSGSMMGGPILQARNALRACLRSLGPQDTFNILAFDDKLEWMSESASGVTQQAIERADRWLDKLDARGGTEILKAIDAALKLEADRERGRYIVFLTDGAVSADAEPLRRVERQIGRARLFTFGVGPSVNRALLARMAELGRGTAEFLQLNEDIEEAIIRFQDRVSYPVLQDLTLDWEGVTPWDVYPSRLPDLYIGQPVEIVGRVRPAGDGPARLRIKGRRGDEPVTLEVNLPAATSADPVILRAWARARIDDLLDRLRNDARQTAALRAEIIGLSIEHHLLTPYTAFVAIDSEVTQGTDSRRRVSVSVPLPEGLEMEGFFGGPDTLMRIAPSAAEMMPRASIAAGFDFYEDIAESPRAMSGPPPASFSLAQKLTDWMRIKRAASDSEMGASEDPLKWLARTQNVSGSWGKGADEVEMTAAAILVFARAGQTHRTGHFRRQIMRAVKWLLAARSSGFAAQARAQALIEIAEAAGDDELLDTARSAQSSLPAVAAPSGTLYSSLDDLRAAALLKKGGEVTPALAMSSDLARVWIAALKEV